MAGTETVPPYVGNKIVAKRDAINLPSGITRDCAFKKGDVGRGFYTSPGNYFTYAIVWDDCDEGSTMVGSKIPFDDWFTGKPVKSTTSLKEYKGGHSYEEMKLFAQSHLGPAEPGPAPTLPAPIPPGPQPPAPPSPTPKECGSCGGCLEKQGCHEHMSQNVCKSKEGIWCRPQFTIV